MIKAATKAVIEGQRKAFFATLRVQDFLVPVDAEAAKAALDALGRPTGAAANVAERVKAEAAEEAEDLVSRHAAALLPSECHRAPTHLQMAALALGAQRALLREAAKEEYGWAGEDTLRARTIVAGALGVVAPPDGSTPYGAPVMWLPNRAAVTLSWDKQATVRRMVDNFKVDLGQGFDVEPLEPAPSVCMTRCLYTDFCRAEGEPTLAPVFWAQHEATFKGVPGYEFEAPDLAGGDDAARCSFWFR